MMWVLVIFNEETDEVEVCGLDDEEGPAKELAQAYAQVRQEQSDRLRFAVTKIRPIAVFRSIS